MSPRAAVGRGPSISMSLSCATSNKVSPIDASTSTSCAHRVTRALCLTLALQGLTAGGRQAVGEAAVPHLAVCFDEHDLDGRRSCWTCVRARCGQCDDEGAEWPAQHRPRRRLELPVVGPATHVSNEARPRRSVVPSASRRPGAAENSSSRCCTSCARLVLLVRRTAPSNRVQPCRTLIRMLVCALAVAPSRT